MTRHLLEIDDLSPAELAAVLDRCAEHEPARVLEGLGAALIFEKPSNRTRNSTEMAVVQLGAHPIYLRAEEVDIDGRESAEDVARTLACYHSVIAARVFDHGVLERMAATVSIPVVNLLSDRSHPLQAIADLLTIRDEFGGFAGRTVTWVGDYSNVARSLALASAMVGMGIRFACPDGYQPSPADLARLADLGAPVVECCDEPKAVVEGADVVVTDAWYSMGQEAEMEQRRRDFAGFGVDASVMAEASPDAIFLHCLPAHRGDEASDDVLDGPQSRIWPQAHNRLHSSRGLLAFLTGVAW